MKVFLTGQKQIGKSTCIQEFIKECQIPCSGYLTLPFYSEGMRIGFYLHSLVPLERNDILFSKDKETILGVFNDFAKEILDHSNSGYLVLDEIGFLERNEEVYLETLIKKIETYPNIIGVLRKCELPYIQEIKSMKDVTILDMDVLGYDSTKNELIKLFKE